MKVTLLTRRDCGLCREAEVLLTRLQAEIQFEVQFVDIDVDKAFRQYQERIPVVLVDGEEAAAAPIDEQRLRAALRR